MEKGINLPVEDIAYYRACDRLEAAGYSQCDWCCEWGDWKQYLDIEDSRKLHCLCESCAAELLENIPEQEREYYEA